MFQDWSTKKLDKYGVDPDIYDHANIKERPSILIDGYAKKKKHLSVIFLWDELKDFILASKYDPLVIGMGEAGLSRTDDETMSGLTYATYLPSKGSKKISPEEQAQQMVKIVVNLVFEKEAASVPVGSKDDTLSIEEQPLTEWMSLYNKYMTNFKF